MCIPCLRPGRLVPRQGPQAPLGDAGFLTRALRAWATAGPPHPAATSARALAQGRGRRRIRAPPGGKEEQGLRDGSHVHVLGVQGTPSFF